MNIIDAVKSGKKFKRPGYIWTSSENLNRDYLRLTKDDILATDWEIEERKIEITETEFDEAVRQITILNEPYATAQLKKRLFET
jgi:hypothetical protein